MLLKFAKNKKRSLPDNQRKTSLLVGKDVRLYVLAILVFLFLLSLFRNVKRLLKVEDDISSIESQVSDLELKKADLEQKKQMVEGEKYIEKELRDKLGLAKEGEIVLVLPEESIVRRFAPSGVFEESGEVLPRWRRWFNLLVK